MFFKGYITLEAVFLGTMFLSILTTPLVIRWAKARGAVDAPGLRKIHAKAVSRVGGIAIVFATMTLIVAILFMDNNVGDAFGGNYVQMAVLLAGAMAMFTVGLIDDLRGVRARHKFLVQLAAAVALCLAGGRIDKVSLGSLGVISTGEWGWLLTIVWIVGVTNAVNLIDGLDGLAAGICLIASGAVAIFAIYTEQMLLAVIMLALLGSLAGFLFLNFNPARVFMGDCGSLFLGFMIAGSSVMCAAKANSLKGIALPALVLGVPILDTLFSMLRRILQRRSMFAPDQGHIHHRLLAMGLEHHEVALLIYIITAISASVGLLMIPTRGLPTVAIFGAGCLMLFIVFRAIGAVRIRETFKGMQRNREIAGEVRSQRERYENAELRLRKAITFPQWWNGVCEAAEELEFSSIQMTVTNRDGSARCMTWAQEPETAAGESVTVSLPIRDRRDDGPLRVDIEIIANGSVESAGRRVGFFGRLVDRYSPADIVPEESV